MVYKQFKQLALEEYEKAKDIDRSNASFEIDCMILHAAHFSKADILKHRFDEIPQDIERTLTEYVARRTNGEPLQYILGEWEFFGLRMFVGPGCLIPRPETELCAETVIKLLPKNGRLLDLCTGSGCIPIAVLNNRPDVTAQAVDISADALRYAEKNMKYHRLEDRLTLIAGDIYEFSLHDTPDVIVSNPPYIKSEDMASLQREVGFEPSLALDGGYDGLDFYKLIVNRFAARLYDGYIVFEVGYDIANEVAAILRAAGFETEILKDLSGVNRVCVGKKTYVSKRKWI